MHFLYFLLGAFSLAQGSVFSRGPSCSEITIPVSIKSKNVYIEPNTDSQDSLRRIMQNVVQGLFSLISKVNTNGQYNIAARYCEPELQNATRKNTIQLLVHGITYDKNYWSGLGAPGVGFNGDMYSWIAYASKHGYPTLSIDRLGNGQSDRPNGLSKVQMNSHIEVTQSLINSLKSGSIGGRNFNKILYVGHWYGSLIGNLHAVKYPDAVDAYMLTGFTKKIRPSLLPTVITGVFLPASHAYPEKWSGQAITYFSPSNATGANKLFFVENVDPKLVDLNFKLRGTVTAGEFITGYEATKTASNYKGRVFVLTGQNDAIFCSPGNFGKGTFTGKGDCGIGEDNLAARTRELYPAAAVYDFSTPSNTGHCNILHRNAQDQFKIAHDWFNRFY